MTQRDRRALILLIAGFTLWSVAFVVLYALQALGCHFQWGAWHRPLLIIVYLVFLIPLAWLAWRKPYEMAGEPASSLSQAALWANRAALGAGVLIFLPVTFASPCI